MEEYIKKSDVLEMIGLPSDILTEHIYELKGVWLDEDYENRRIKEALRLAWSYGQIGGDWHKTWVIDQMVRALCGSEEEYNKWVEVYETPLCNDDYYEWNTGIAP